MIADMVADTDITAVIEEAVEATEEASARERTINNVIMCKCENVKMPRRGWEVDVHFQIC
jgi:hypothetical protein